LLPTREQMLALRGQPVSDDPYAIAEPTRQALLQACRERDLHCLDLAPIMEREFPDLDPIFIPSDTPGKLDFHFNKLGHRSVGEALGRFLAGLHSPAPNSP
jgi:hypothetical protein